MLKNEKDAGFTLIELLVVIAILGILAAIGLVAFTSAQARGRDAKRKSDLKQIATALELYYSDYREYPPSSSGQIKGCPSTGSGTACDWGAPDNTSAFMDDVTVYMRIVPADPSGYNYYYRTVTIGNSLKQGFQLYAHLENPQDPSCLAGSLGKSNCAAPVVPAGVTSTSCGSVCNFALTSPNVTATDP